MVQRFQVRVEHVAVTMYAVLAWIVICTCIGKYLRRRHQQNFQSPGVTTTTSTNTNGGRIGLREPSSSPSHPLDEVGSEKSDDLESQSTGPKNAVFGGGEYTILVESCSICLATFVDQEHVATSSKCYHVFHHYCIAEWIRYDPQRTCPCCRCTFHEWEVGLIASVHDHHPTTTETTQSHGDLETGTVARLEISTTDGRDDHHNNSTNDDDEDKVAECDDEDSQDPTKDTTSIVSIQSEGDM